MKLDPSFVSLPIVDGHVHFVHPERMDEILAIMQAAHCTRFNLVCVPNRDGTTHNPAAVQFKQRYPERVYISGALDYRPVLVDPVRATDLLASQVMQLKARGFDGLKLIEGKPEVRRLLPFRIDGPEYAGMWSVLEQEEFPVVFHVADPDEFWDPAACPDWARQAGWDYSDGSFPSKEALYAEVEAVLIRHPGLKIIFAHFYFLSRDLERAGRFLEAHPTVGFDLEMYRDFSRVPDQARAFFLKFQERLSYGTDIDTRVLQRGPDGLQFLQSIPRLIRTFLEGQGEFDPPGGAVVHGLGLPNQALAKIYSTNFERYFGVQPARLVEELGRWL
jgi:predicted TIM-barrel fold metal-dependent hydrolase